MGSSLGSSWFDNIGVKYEEAFGRDKGLTDFITKALEMTPSGATVLDIGCGTGNPVGNMIVANRRHLHGIDNSAKMIELSRQQVPGGWFKQVSMFDFIATAPFDAAFAMFSLLDSLPDLSALIQRINQWIVLGGHLFVGTMCADDFAVDAHHIYDDQHGAQRIRHKFMGTRCSTLVYTKNGWTSLLRQSGFDIIETSMVPYQPPEEADSDFEPHYYIAAKKVTEVRSASV